ncbi:hypothetical protein BURPS305_0136 [Burkholderia pseudomallei 305]|uniref:Uncharacterized protein n=2 Tax=pseudomallei group TaxID=111527 RepID=A2S232_BURM9|nr:hypothetical protein BMASAVP1_1757 [Burkholderia mallei SAVP1]ABN00226.2 hypothetical protein BMA10229_2209 [Burkholderia mallei NCTC 10229]EBA44503.1 hypothetical protein BURPS305_0136 [Burkholderia pseudomallei 305]EEH24358.1 hypothetical protein BUH_4777 [Burkholderia pseudomallei Pakistan 9]EEP83270.1 hypothetical protein BMAGB8_A0962 [Burkholderia mallei GB8 horse 4]EET05342.1 hypothetical protein BURPS1710A_A2986 [Burkholderia pseudomallei 1710a]
MKPRTANGARPRAHGPRRRPAAAGRSGSSRHPKHHSVR